MCCWNNFRNIVLTVNGLKFAILSIYGQITTFMAVLKENKSIKKQDCDQSENLCQCQNFNQKRSRIWNRIAELIQIQINMSCSISPKMLWIHDLVCVSHYSKLRKSPTVTARKMLINLLKSPILQWQGKWKSDPKSVSATGAPPTVNQFFQLVGPIITPSFNEIGSLLFQ